MKMSLNDKLTELYKILDNLDIELKRQVANVKTVTSFDMDIIRKTALQRNNILKAIDKIKLEADNNFLKFIQTKLESKPTANDYKKIRELLAIKTKTIPQERLVIINDTVCVNESVAKKINKILDSFTPQKDKQTASKNKSNTELNGQISIDFDMVNKKEKTVEEIANNKLLELITNELSKIESKNSKTKKTADNGKEIAAAYHKEYNRLLKLVELLDFKDTEKLENVLDLAYVPSILQEEFTRILTETDFYQMNYDYNRKKEANEALIAELVEQIAKTDDILEQENAKRVIKLLKTNDKKLTGVWNIGYVPAKSVSLFKDLILNSKHLSAKLEENNNTKVLAETLASLNNLQSSALDNPNAILVDSFIVSPENLAEATALSTKYKILKDGLDSNKQVTASDNTQVASKDLKKYEKAINELNLINKQKEQQNTSPKIASDKETPKVSENILSNLFNSYLDYNSQVNYLKMLSENSLMQEAMKAQLLALPPHVETQLEIKPTIYPKISNKELLVNMFRDYLDNIKVENTLRINPILIQDNEKSNSISELESELSISEDSLKVLNKDLLVNMFTSYLNDIEISYLSRTGQTSLILDNTQDSYWTQLLDDSKLNIPQNGLKVLNREILDNMFSNYLNNILALSYTTYKKQTDSKFMDMPELQPTNDRELPTIDLFKNYLNYNSQVNYLKMLSENSLIQEVMKAPLLALTPHVETQLEIKPTIYPKISNKELLVSMFKDYLDNIKVENTLRINPILVQDNEKSNSISELESELNISEDSLKVLNKDLLVNMFTSYLNDIEISYLSRTGQTSLILDNTQDSYWTQLLDDSKINIPQNGLKVLNREILDNMFSNYLNNVLALSYTTYKKQTDSKFMDMPELQLTNDRELPTIDLFKNYLDYNSQVNYLKMLSENSLMQEAMKAPLLALPPHVETQLETKPTIYPKISNKELLVNMFRNYLDNIKVENTLRINPILVQDNEKSNSKSELESELSISRDSLKILNKDLLVNMFTSYLNDIEISYLSRTGQTSLILDNTQDSYWTQLLDDSKLNIPQNGLKVLNREILDNMFSNYLNNILALSYTTYKKQTDSKFMDMPELQPTNDRELPTIDLFKNYLNYNSQVNYLKKLSENSLMQEAMKEQALSLPPHVEENTANSELQDNNYNVVFQKEALIAMQKILENRKKKYSLQHEALTKVLALPPHTGKQISNITSPDVIELSAGTPIYALPQHEEKVHLSKKKISDISLPDVIELSAGESSLQPDTQAKENSSKLKSQKELLTVLQNVLAKRKETANVNNYTQIEKIIIDALHDTKDPEQAINVALNKILGRTPESNNTELDNIIAESKDYNIDTIDENFAPSKRVKLALPPHQEKIHVSKKPQTKLSIPDVIELSDGKPTVEPPIAQSTDKKIETILAEALNSSENPEQAINAALNKILSRSSESDSSELSSIVSEYKDYEPVNIDEDFVPPKRYNPSAYEPEQISLMEETPMVIPKEPVESTSTIDTNAAINEFLSELDAKINPELEKILKEAKDLIGYEQSKSNSEAGLLVPNSTSLAKVNSKPEPLSTRIRKWSGKKFKNMKIFLDSVMAVGLAEENRLDRNPCITRIACLIENIKVRAKRSFDEYNGYYDVMPNLYDFNQEESEKLEIDPSLLANVSEYDKTLIVGMEKSKKLIDEAMAKIQEIQEFIRKCTEKRYAPEYFNITQLEFSIRLSRQAIAEAQKNPNEDSEIIIFRNEKAIKAYEKRIQEIKDYIIEHSNEAYISEYSRIRDLQNSISFLNEKITLIQLKLYKNAKENNNLQNARVYRDSIMKITSIDLDKYFDLEYAKKDIQMMLSLENEELVSRMKYIIQKLDDVLRDTQRIDDLKKFEQDRRNLIDSVSELENTSIRLFR